MIFARNVLGDIGSWKTADMDRDPHIVEKMRGWLRLWKDMYIAGQG